MKISSRTYTDRASLGNISRLLPCRARLPHVGPHLRGSRQNAQEALALYLETFDELGKTIPEKKDVDQRVSLNITVRMPVIA